MPEIWGLEERPSYGLNLGYINPRLHPLDAYGSSECLEKYARLIAGWRGYAPQKPKTRAIERNNAAVGRGLAKDCPRIKRSRKTQRLTSS